MALHVTVQKDNVSSSFLDGSQPGLSLISSKVCASVCTHIKRVVGLIVEREESLCSLRVLRPSPTIQRHECEANREL